MLTYNQCVSTYKKEQTQKQYIDDLAAIAHVQLIKHQLDKHPNPLVRQGLTSIFKFNTVKATS